MKGLVGLSKYERIAESNLDEVIALTSFDVMTFLTPSPIIALRRNDEYYVIISSVEKLNTTAKNQYAIKV